MDDVFDQGTILKSVRVQKVHELTSLVEKQCEVNSNRTSSGTVNASGGDSIVLNARDTPIRVA